MRRLRRSTIALFVVALPSLALAVPLSASADVFGPISLVSEGVAPGGSVPQQFEYAHDPAISGDGRYVAFDGSFGGVTGVWRRDLSTGEVQQVAGGDAELPSISEDGRYISFTTNEGKALARITNDELDAPEPEAVNVYVRDMSVGPEEPGAFTVASAPTGSEEPLTYPPGSTTTGSTSAGRSAISGDGREVAFVTTAVSDLADPQTPSTPTTPALQVAVRYLDSKETKLVSVDRETGGPVSGVEAGQTYGAVYAGLGASQAGFVSPPAYGQYGRSPLPGASISADGSTVAWMGADVGEQAPTLAGETPSPSYTEPLWRRIASGSETAAERVTGGSDPQNPACATSGETALPQPPSPADPCQGPFVTPEGGQAPFGLLIRGATSQFIPRLSADGYTVAFVSQAPLVAFSEFFGSFGEQSDLYVVDMHAGLTRDQAITQLTQIDSKEGGAATDGGIFDFDISADGSQVAFTTDRTVFTLGSPAFISTRAPEPGMEELFDADLVDHTLTRVTQGVGGGPSERSLPVEHIGGLDPYSEGDGALSPSLSADGSEVAFSSTASNLVWGDGNTPSNRGYGKTEDGSDAFVVERRAFVSIPTSQFVSPPNEPQVSAPWQLGVTALSRADGSVLLYVRVPAPGALAASARSAILVRAAHAARSSRRKHPHRSARKASRGAAKPTVAARTVAGRRAQIAASGLTTLLLKLATPYSALASEPGGLSSMVTVTFAVAGQPGLRQSIPVTFLRTAKASNRKARKAKSGRRR